MKRFFFHFFSFSSRVFSKLSRFSLSSARKLDTIDGWQRNVIGSARYDMLVAPDEPYYAKQYWAVILPLLDTLPKDAKALDLGCSQGRFTIRLGKLFTQGHVVGCDLSEEAITNANSSSCIKDGGTSITDKVRGYHLILGVS